MTISRLATFKTDDSIGSNALNKELNNIVYYINKLTAGSISSTSSFSYIDLVPQSTAPAVKQGRLYFNSVDQQLYICKDGITWSIAA